MTLQALYSAATGMTSMQTRLDVISNNLANIETTGYKRMRANFEDLFYRHEKLPGAQDAAGQYTAVGTSIGLGSRVQSTQAEFTQGSFQDTGRKLDVAIAGRGFFQVVDPSGEIYYTRAGNFSINANGNLVIGSASTGRLLEPPITIPEDATDIEITADGKVSVQQPGTDTLNEVGTIELATFVNPEGLLRLGENLYSQSDASGSPTNGQPGQEGIGVLRQSTLEASNVEPVEELIDLITTQRAFEMNSQAIKAGDELLQVVTNLRR